MSKLIQFDLHRPTLGQAVSSALAAVEIDTFDSVPANDNGPDDAQRLTTRQVAVWLPATVIAAGLSAALLVTAAAHLCGFTS